MILPRTALLGALAVSLLASRAEALHYPGEGRKTTAHDLAVTVHRELLPNGLVVLLAPDPGATGVLVSMTFRAGAIYEPAKRSGLAHLVEHVMFTGPTPATDVAALLEQRRARWVNAATDFEDMRFDAEVPAEELPLALWASAERLAAIPPLIDATMVERHRRVVLQERTFRDVDVPYGLANERLFGRLFAAPHPLHGGVGGTPAELAQISAEEVRQFVADHLVPANGILTLVGRFDEDQARKLVAASVGRLPSGRRVKLPAVPPPWGEVVDSAEERVSREPGVRMAWRLRGVDHDDAVTLRLGAQLLTVLTDGAFGMRLGADLMEQSNESLFFLDLSVPYDEPVRAVQDDAEGFLRQLTGREMSFELLQIANLALDRGALFGLDTLAGRAGILTRLEEVSASKISVAQECAAHWLRDPVTVHDTARAYLRAPKVVVHARPIRPRPARAEGQ